MNWIGEFGSFIIRYQHVAEVVLLSLVVLAAIGLVPVSYTQLDVYKRQGQEVDLNPQRMPERRSLISS